ncbi:MAG: hypothetical protein ACI9FJ_002279 [Alteromonadaceae bacterium]
MSPFLSDWRSLQVLTAPIPVVSLCDELQAEG